MLYRWTCVLVSLFLQHCWEARISECLLIIQSYAWLDSNDNTATALIYIIILTAHFWAVLKHWRRNSTHTSRYQTQGSLSKPIWIYYQLPNVFLFKYAKPHNQGPAYHRVVSSVEEASDAYFHLFILVTTLWQTHWEHPRNSPLPLPGCGEGGGCSGLSILFKVCSTESAYTWWNELWPSMSPNSGAIALYERGCSVQEETR